MLMGHIYMIILVFVCQTAVYREVTSLFALTHKDTGFHEAEHRRDPWSKTLNWYFFAIANYFLYGETIIYYFKVSGPAIFETSVYVISACRIRRRIFPAIRYESSLHKFYSILHW